MQINFSEKIIYLFHKAEITKITKISTLIYFHYWFKSDIIYALNSFLQGMFQSSTTKP